MGCGSSEPSLAYANVSGTVNYNGKPLDKGVLTFSVAGLPPTVMDIVDGKYTGQAGIGSNKVSVSAKRKSTAATNLPPQAIQQMKEYAKKGANPDFDPTMQDYMPPEWGASGKQTRVVEAGGANKFDFDIKGK